MTNMSINDGDEEKNVNERDEEKMQMKDMCLDEKYDVDEGDECQKMSVDKRYEREEIYECE